VGWGFVEGDAQPDLDVPAGDADFLDEQPQELLLLDGVELVNHAADPFGEVVDSAVDLVAAGQGRALLSESGAFRLQLAMAGGDISGPPLQLSQLDQPGLVKVDEASLLRVGGVDLAVQASELGGEQLIVRDRCGDGDAVFTGQQQLGLQQRLF
jgi:hypothetical protein